MLQYVSSLFVAEVESIALDDVHLRTNWQRDELFHVLLKRKEAAAMERYGILYLYDDKVIIYYNIKDGRQVSYIEAIGAPNELENLRPAPEKIKNNQRSNSKEFDR